MSIARRVTFLLAALVLAAVPLTAATATGIVPSVAPHGARFIVTGIGLDVGSLAIAFRGANVSNTSPILLSRTSTAVEAIVPADATTGPVSVSIDGVGLGSFPFTLAPDPSFLKVVTLAASETAHDVLKQPSGIAVTSTGLVVVADRMHHRILTVAPNGTVSVLAGNGSPGFVDGMGAKAQLNEPRGVAIDESRRLIYVADTMNNAIRAVTSDGVVTTLAGSGRPDDVNGVGSGASLKQPIGIALDATGTLYIADTGNSKIKIVTPAGVVSALAGAGHPGLADGPVATALFKEPEGIAVTAAGTIYIADTKNSAIRKIEGTTVTTIAGTGHEGFVDGPAGSAEFKQPSQLAVDEGGNVWIADTQNSAVRLVHLVGGALTVSTLAGQQKAGYSDGPLTTAFFKSPAGIAFAGALFVGDSGNDAVRVIYPEVHVTGIDPQLGPPVGGNTVRIFGSGFIAGVTQALFGTAAAKPVTYVSPTEVLVAAPAGAPGLVDVSVTTLAGRDVLAQAYRYLPPPTIATLDRTKGKIAGGELVTITGTDFLGGGTSVSFGGSASSSVTVMSSTTLTAVTPAGAPGPVDVSVATPGGTATKVAAFTYYAPPTITSFRPPQGSAGTVVTITGQNFDPAPDGNRIAFNGAATIVTSATPTQLVTVVPAGATNGKISIATVGGTVISASDFTVAAFVRLQIAAPATTLDIGQSLHFSSIGVLTNGTGSDVTPTTSWSSNSPSVTVTTTGIVTAVATGGADITASFGSLTATVHVSVVAVTLPPDPAAVAAPVVTTAIPLFRDAFAFLYSGPNPIQTGVAADTIDFLRAAVIRGTVHTRDSAPLRGVRITVAGHAEYGQTLSRADGRFDLAVNGGGPLTLRYERSGFLPVDRRIVVPWRDLPPVDDVVLIPLDGNVSVIAANAPTTQVAMGSVSVDKDGSRNATLIFPAGTSASMQLPDKSSQNLSSLTVRITEYSVGANGPSAMPAPLPPQSAYTYCVELSADEAIAANATGVAFSRPVIVFVDNFLNLPVGTTVPVGYYDRTASRWQGSNNGVVVKVLAVGGGTALLDLDGDGVPDSATALATFGIGSAELQQIAALYPAGKTLWCARIDHFTPFDLNLPWVAPVGGRRPKPRKPSLSGPRIAASVHCHGSDIDCDNQVLGERLGIAGTGTTLVYSSDRQRGRRDAYAVDIYVTDDAPPGVAVAAELKLDIAGQHVEQTFAPTPNLTYHYEWDGRDAYGRDLHSGMPLNIQVGYSYDQAAYTDDKDGRGIDWATLSDGTRLETSVRGGKITLWTSMQVVLGGTVDNKLLVGLGGWSLSVHHVYDPATKILYLGSGQTRAADAIGGVLKNIAGNGNFGAPIDGVSASQTPLLSPSALAAAADGSFIVGDSTRVLRVSRDGIVHVIGGTGRAGNSGDGGPAVSAALEIGKGTLGSDGSFYFGTVDFATIRRISPDGVITTVAGNGKFCDGTKPLPEGPATSVCIYSNTIDSGAITPAVADDGTIYLGSSSAGIAKITPDGQLTRLVTPFGTQTPAEGVPLTLARFTRARTLAVDHNGSLYIYDDQLLYRVDGDGILHVIGGSRTPASAFQEGVSATSIALPFVSYIAPASGGSIYLAASLSGGNRILLIRPDGSITTVAGRDGFSPTAPDGALAVGVPLQFMNSIAAMPDGRILFTSSELRVKQVATAYPALAPGELTIASESANEAYVFDPSGHHLRTVDASTGIVVFSFTYDANGYLTRATDRDGNALVVERDATSNPTALIAPGGQRTSLTVDSDGYLATVQDPGGEVTTLTHRDGLLTSLKTPRQGLYQFDYDSIGRLVRDSDPAGGSTTLTRVGTAESFMIRKQSAEGRSSVLNVTLSGASAARSLTGTSGLTMFANTGADLSINVTTTDGTVFRGARDRDPRFGMQAPIGTALTITTPGGLTATMSGARSAALSDPANPFSLTSRTDSFTFNGQTFTRTFTATTRTWSSRSPAGRSISQSLNSQGRIASVSLPGTAAVSYQYDGRGRLTFVSQASRSTAYTYNDSNLVTSIKDALGRTVGFEYDANGRVIRKTLPDGRQLQIARDPDGNITSITPPERPAHTFTYTAVDEGESYTAPSVPNAGGVTRLTFNRDRQVTAALRPDGTSVSYGYDSAGRLADIAAPIGSAHFTYDASGSPASATASGVTLTYTRDGVLPRSIAWNGVVNGSIAITYDNNLRPTSKRIVGGSSISYGYDRDGLVTAAGPETIVRDAANGRVTSTSAGVIADSISYDANGSVSDYAATVNGAPLLSFHYTHDASGRITAISESDGGNAVYTRSFVYDDAGRLTTVNSDSSFTAYRYDGNSNRLARTTPGGEQSCTYDDQDRLLTYGDASFTYTPNGEIESKTTPAGTTTYGYDSFGRLISTHLPDDRLIEYILDGRGRRVVKKVNGVVVAKFIYDNGLRPLAQLGADDSVVAQFVYAVRANTPSLILRDGSTYRVIADHLGSPRFIMNVDTGAVADTLGFDEFGVEFESNPGFQPFGFGGGLYDADTKLVHFGAREYDANTGRFITKDPIVFGGGQLNIYDYAANDPVNFADPSGLLFGGAVNAGEAYGDEATDFYADVLTDPESKWWQKAGSAFLGSFSALWTPCTSDATFLTLSLAYGVNAELVEYGAATELGGADNPYWRYVGPRSNPDSPWMTRGATPPYGDDFAAAKDALQLPNTPTDVNPVEVKWWEPVRGPRTVEGNPSWGSGGGTEYARGWTWPN